MSLTKQQVDPHPELVACRNHIQEKCNCLRSEAAAVCNHLSDKQVEAVLSADTKAKVEAAIKPAKEEAVKEVEEKEAKQESKKPAKKSKTK